MISILTLDPEERAEICAARLSLKQRKSVFTGWEKFIIMMTG